jgi:hypothetical protein
VGGTPEEFAHKRDVLHQHCREVGRDASEILLSSHVRHTGAPEETAALAAALGAAGADLAIVVLPPPLTPSVLEPLAKALADIG